MKYKIWFTQAYANQRLAVDEIWNVDSFNITECGALIFYSNGQAIRVFGRNTWDNFVVVREDK